MAVSLWYTDNEYITCIYYICMKVGAGKYIFKELYICNENVMFTLCLYLHYLVPFMHSDKIGNSHAFFVWIKKTAQTREQLYSITTSLFIVAMHSAAHLKKSNMFFFHFQIWFSSEISSWTYFTSPTTFWWVATALLHFSFFWERENPQVFISKVRYVIMLWFHHYHHRPCSSQDS